MTDVTLEPVEHLLAIEEIKRLFAGRLRCLDAKEWDRYGDFHTEDVVSDTWRDNTSRDKAGDDSVVVGRDALTRAISRALGGPVAITTVHHGHTPEIELLSDTEARGVWAMEDKLWWDNNGVQEHLHGYGHYHEHYRREHGRWLISRRTLTRLRVDMTPGFFSYLR